MNSADLKKVIVGVVCVILMVALSFVFIGTDTKPKGDTEKPSTQEANKNQQSVEQQKSTEIGEGSMLFFLAVTDKEGNKTNFVIHTDKKTVGEALLELALIEGEEGPHGMFIKKVNGIVADYDVDQTYWAFYINGQYASTGVDETDVKSGTNYELKVEK